MLQSNSFISYQAFFLWMYEHEQYTKKEKQNSEAASPFWTVLSKRQHLYETLAINLPAVPRN